MNWQGQFKFYHKLDYILLTNKNKNALIGMKNNTIGKWKIVICLF